MKTSILSALLICFLGISTLHAQSSWPQKLFTTDGLSITIYQPQSEDLKGNALTGRAALSVNNNAGNDPVFGVCWFNATLANSNNKLAELTSISISHLKLPDSTHRFKSDLIINAIQTDLPKKNIQFDVTELNNAVKQEQKNNNPTLNNSAPNIIYRTKPSTLVVLDGEPKFEMDSKFNLERIINTPSLIVRNPQDNLLYFYGGGIWYSAADIKERWSFVKYLPTPIQKVDDLIHQDTKANDKANDNNVNKATTPSDIIVSTSPAELIQTEGEATYQSIEETNLLYADNSLDDIFKDVNTQHSYILVSGRWYKSSSLNGPWTYVPANQLPQDFAKIPEGSEKDGVLTHVAGTEAANDAVMNAQVPQTAKIDRKSVTCNVTYEGEPSFTPINGTNMMVAENSNITVLKSNRRYYAVDNGVWFVSNTPEGPWAVSTERPHDVDNIPADNIAYNTRYVYVYDYDPEYVWTGYTPGYTGCYVYGPTVVWGTGYYYNPWYHHHYFSRPYTWGFGMQYNPWSGWGFSYNMWPSIGWGWYDNGWYGGSWFGPRYYRPGCNSWGYNGGYYGYGDYYMRNPRVNYNRPRYANGNMYNHPRGDRNHYASNDWNNNIYHRVKGAQTTDVVQQPHRNNFSNNDGIIGRPNGNQNLNQHNNGFRPGQNQVQEHFNGQNNAQNANGNNPPRGNSGQSNPPQQHHNNSGADQVAPPQQHAGNNNTNQQPQPPRQHQTSGDNGGGNYQQEIHNPKPHFQQPQQNIPPRNIAPPRTFNPPPARSNNTPPRSGNNERSSESNKGGSGNRRGR